LRALNRSGDLLVRHMPRTGTLYIELRCAKCHQNRISLPDVHSDDTVINCGFCNTELGPYGSLKTELSGHVGITSSAEISDPIFEPLNEMPSNKIAVDARRLRDGTICRAVDLGGGLAQTETWHPRHGRWARGGPSLAELLASDEVSPEERSRLGPAG
jgi:hypothetical protein